MAMLDHERYESLHSIIMLKDVIRKWWGLELAFADRTGHVVDHSAGRIIPPNNDFCRLSLFSRKGFKRCQESLKVLGRKFQASKKPRRCLFHDCHLGFTAVGGPIVVGGKYKGFIFVDGFARERPTPGQEEQLKKRTRTLNPAATDLDRAIQRLPVLSSEEVEKLRDLLEFGADELSAFETEIHSGEISSTGAGQSPDRYRIDAIVGESESIRRVRHLVEKVSAFETPLLLQGENGTGKEFVARVIHHQSSRRNKVFLVQDCSVLEGEEFERAFFGAAAKASRDDFHSELEGIVGAADSGTLFLDEVGDLCPRAQAKVLNFLIDGTYLPVGGTTVRSVDVRIIAASRRSLLELVRQGKFREDLYYRIAVIEIGLPPLRERRQDIPLLVQSFFRKNSPSGHPQTLGATKMEQLIEHHWPGNIRELEHQLERLIVLGAETSIPDKGLSIQAPPANEANQSSLTSSKFAGTLKKATENLEREMIHQSLMRYRWNKSRVARELGMSRSNLIAKCEKYGLVQPNVALRATSDKG